MAGLGDVRNEIPVVVVAEQPGKDELGDVTRGGLSGKQRIDRIDVAEDPDSQNAVRRPWIRGANHNARPDRRRERQSRNDNKGREEERSSHNITPWAKRFAIAPY